MDYPNKISSVQHQNGVSYLALVFFIGIFVIAFALAIYVTKPVGHATNEMNTFNQQDLKQEIDHSKTNNEHQLDKNQPPKKVGFLQALFSKEKNKSQELLTEKSFELTEEYRNYLDVSYAELYGSAYSNRSDESLPSISGRVLDPNGKPLQGIEIRAIKRDYFQKDNTNLASLPGYTTTTNAMGFYAYKKLEDGIYLLKTKSNKRYLPESIEVNTGVNFADIILEELQSLELKGSVIDSVSGQALGEVNVTPLVKGIPKSGKTDQTGAFNLEFSVGEARAVQLRLRKTGYKDKLYTVDLNDWENQLNLEIPMQASSAFGSLIGTISTTTNQSIGGQLIELYSANAQANYKTRTDSNGHYAFTNIEEASDYKIWVRPMSDYQDYSRESLSISTRSANLDIVLEPLDQSYELSGQVVGIDNQPIKNITLALRSVDARNHIVPIATDAFGNYFANNVPSGVVVIESSSSPYYTISGISLGGENRSSYQKFIVDRGQQKFLGKVVDDEGQPIQAPRISITSTLDINGMRTQASRSTSADANGKFLFTDLGATQYMLTVNAPGYKGVRINHRLDLDSQVTIRLKRESI